MSVIYEWITNIILIILLATILELLLPSSSFQKYIKVVIGLLLIIAILNPIIRLFSIDFNDELSAFQIDGYENEKENVKNLLEKNKSEIQASVDAYTLRQMAVQLENQVKGKLEENYGKRLKKVEVQNQSKNDSERKRWIIHVTLAEANEQTNEIEPVEEVSIDTTQQPSTEVMKDDPQLLKIKRFLSKQWEVPVDDIIVNEEGGS